MTIRSAVLSGKPFKRKRWTEWYVYDKRTTWVFPKNVLKKDRNFENATWFSFPEIIATDWTIKNKEK